MVVHCRLISGVQALKASRSYRVAALELAVGVE